MIVANNITINAVRIVASSSRHCRAGMTTVDKSPPLWKRKAAATRSRAAAARYFSVATSC
jgi:uncharacterized protein YlxW (UPF0749 family)